MLGVESMSAIVDEAISAFRPKSLAPGALSLSVSVAVAPAATLPIDQTWVAWLNNPCVGDCDPE